MTRVAQQPGDKVRTGPGAVKFMLPLKEGLSSLLCLQQSTATWVLFELLMCKVSAGKGLILWNRTPKGSFLKVTVMKIFFE